MSEGGASTDQAATGLRHALGAGDLEGARRSIDALAATHTPPRVAIDACERCCALADAATLSHAIHALRPAYLGWGYALALRHANRDTARLLMSRGCDLLEDPPDLGAGDGPGVGALARLDLTRSSANLLLDLHAGSVADNVFGPRDGAEALAGPPIEDTATVDEAASLTLDLMRQGAFDSVVVDDLFRTALAAADACLRGKRAGGDGAHEALLAFARDVVALHDEVGFGSRYLALLAGSLFRPHARRELLTFVAEAMPAVFLERVEHLSWLRRDPALVAAIASGLDEAGVASQDLSTLLRVLAAAGDAGELSRIASWEGALTLEALVAGVDAATAEHHAEAALALLEAQPRFARERPLEGLEL